MISRTTVSSLMSTYSTIRTSFRYGRMNFRETKVDQCGLLRQMEENWSFHLFRETVGSLVTDPSCCFFVETVKKQQTKPITYTVE